MQTKTMTLNMGPQHPATHGVLRVILELDGERVIEATPVIGYLHTGIEKTAESKLYHKVVPLTDRMDYLAPMSNNLGYCLAVEKLLDLEIPLKAQWTRVFMTEMTRINSHLVWIGTHAIDLGAMSMVLYAFREREHILGLYELLSGQRMMSSYFQIGGLLKDLPANFKQEAQKVLDLLPSRIGEYEDLLTQNRIWRNRTIGVGKISKEEALKSSLTGPMLRACGIGYDVRKAVPYSCYDNFDFEIPIRTEGDVFARYEVRVAEMYQSLKIAQQALDGIPDGPYRANAPGIVSPPKEKVLTEMEAMIFHFKIVTEGFHPPKGEVYVGIESPKGEIGFYIVSDGSPKPYRMRVRPPSFINLASLPKLCRGGLLSDVIANIGSVDIVLGEVDR